MLSNDQEFENPFLDVEKKHKTALQEDERAGSNSVVEAEKELHSHMEDGDW